MTLQALIQPTTDEFQFPVNGGLRGAQKFSGFFGGKSQKEAQFDHAAFALVEFLKLIKNTIEIHQFNIFGINPRQFFVQRNGGPTVPFLPSFTPRVIQKNTAHQPSGKAVEMLTIFESQTSLTDELQEQLVHHACWLQYIFRTLSAKQGACDLSQLRIDDIEKTLDGVGPSLAPLSKKFSDVTRLAQSPRSLFRQIPANVPLADCEQMSGFQDDLSARQAGTAWSGGYSIGPACASVIPEVAPPSTVNDVRANEVVRHPILRFATHQWTVLAVTIWFAVRQDISRALRACCDA